MNISTFKKTFKLLFPQLSIVFVGILLTAIFTWPYILNLGTFYYDHGDFPVSGSILAYNEQALRTGSIFNRDEYFNGNEFYPQPYSLVYFDARIIASLIYSPIFWVTQNFVLSLNLVTFLTFTLSFVTSFYTINYFVKNKAASIIGATVYAFNPQVLARFPEHFDLLNRYILPLVFLFAYRYLKTPNLKNAFLFFLFFTLNAFSAIYFQVFTILLLPVFALPFLLKNFFQKNKLYFWNLFKFSLIFLLFLPILWYIDGAYLEFAAKEGTERNIESHAFFSARVVDYITTTPRNLLYGGFVQSLEPYRTPKDSQGYFNYREHSLFLNIIPSLLFILAVILYFKKGQYKTEVLTFPFIILLITSFILTFGPYFQGLNSSSSHIRLPYYYLYKLIPILKGVRAPVRFQFIFYIPFTIFLAYAASFLFQRIKKAYFIITLLLLILFGLFIENYTPDGPIFPYNKSSSIIGEVNRINIKGQQLTTLAGKKAIHFPIRTLGSDGLDSAYLNWAAVTSEKIVNGNAASYMPLEQYTFLAGLQGKLDESSLKKLAAVNVEMVIIHRNLFSAQDPNIDFQPLPQSLMYDDGNTIIFDLGKYHFDVKKCSLENDFDLNFKAALIPQLMQTVHVLDLKNKSDCYLPSIYKDKYRSTDFNGQDFYGNTLKRKAYFKLPVLIGPFEEIVLSEINNGLRVE